MNAKKEFLKNGDDARFLFELTASDRFQRAVTYALMEYAEELALKKPADPHAAAAAHWQHAGAIEFVRVLSGLCEAAKPAPRKETGNLIHK